MRARSRPRSFPRGPSRVSSRTCSARPSTGKSKSGSARSGRCGLLSESALSHNNASTRFSPGSLGTAFPWFVRCSVDKAPRNTTLFRSVFQRTPESGIIRKLSGDTAKCVRQLVSKSTITFFFLRLQCSDKAARPICTCSEGRRCHGAPAENIQVPAACNARNARHLGTHTASCEGRRRTSCPDSGATDSLRTRGSPAHAAGVEVLGDFEKTTAGISPLATIPAAARAIRLPSGSTGHAAGRHGRGDAVRGERPAGG